MTLMLLLEAALRALALGASVWILLRLTRLRDARSETLVWTLVLLMALAMPLLERWSPAPLTFRLAAPAAARLAAKATPHAATGWNWLTAQGAALLWGLYFAVAAFGLARLALGFVLTARLYCRACPVAAPWAQGRIIRASAAIRGPLAFGTAILLPADYREWPQAKLAAVLAHEESHVRRGDFFIQLLAGLYRAIFWFSPFAWWLQARLCALGEAASDQAAISASGDPASYAEILIEVARHATAAPMQVAMAKGPDIAWRIDRILDESAPPQSPDLRLRTAAMAAVLPAALAIAAIHAAPAAALPHRSAVAEAKSAGVAPVPRLPAAAPPHRARPAAVTYDPRALLRDPTAVRVNGLVLATGG